MRREVGSDRRAAVVEDEWEGAPLPPNARLLRVEADEPVGVFVERTWPQADYGYRQVEIRRVMLEVVPVEPRKPPVAPGSLGEVAWVLREAGVLDMWAREQEGAA